MFNPFDVTANTASPIPTMLIFAAVIFVFLLISDASEKAKLDKMSNDPNEVTDETLRLQAERERPMLEYQYLQAMRTGDRVTVRALGPTIYSEHGEYLAEIKTANDLVSMK